MLWIRPALSHIRAFVWEVILCVPNSHLWNSPHPPRLGPKEAPRALPCSTLHYEKLYPVVNSLFNLNFTNLHNLSHPSTCHSALCIGGIQENFDGFSIFTTKYDEVRNIKDAIRDQDMGKNKPCRYPEQPESTTLQSRAGSVSRQPWSGIYLPAALSSAFLRQKALEAALDSAASPGTLAFTSQEEHHRAQEQQNEPLEHPFRSPRKNQVPPGRFQCLPLPLLPRNSRGSCSVCCSFHLPLWLECA